MTRLIALLACTLLAAATSAAQPRPDFSGTWNMDEARSVSPTHEGFTGPVVWTVTQSADKMTVQIARGPRTFTLTYTIHDEKPRVPIEGVPSYTGYWEGDRLVTETVLNIQGQTVTTREVRSLQADNREMIVERLVEVEHGYTLRGGQNYNTAKDTFVRAAP